MKRRYRGARILGVLAMAGVVALVVACGSGSSATPAPTATPSGGATWGVPTVAFDTMHVDLGTVPRDQLGTQTFLVMNRGRGPLDVGPVEIQVEQGCNAAKTVQGEMRLQMGDVALLPIQFGTHTKLGPHRLLVNVPTSDPAMPVATLTLVFNVIEAPTAVGPGPRLRVDKDKIDIGDVPSDQPLYERFTLRNDGDAPLVMDGAPRLRIEDGC